MTNQSNQSTSSATVTPIGVAAKIMPVHHAEFAYQVVLKAIRRGMQRLVLDLDHPTKPSMTCFNYYEGHVEVVEVEMIAYVHFGGDINKLLPNNLLATESYSSIIDFANAYGLGSETPTNEWP